MLPALVRDPWVIERLHCVRDFTCDEDHCRVPVRPLPRRLSCLTHAARAQDALDAILIPPGG